MDDKEHYLQQIQAGESAKEQLQILTPLLEVIQTQVLQELQEERQEQMAIMLCKAQLIVCKRIQDKLRNKIASGKLAKKELEDLK